MTEREKLKIKILEIVQENKSNFTLESTYEAIVDFIVYDRKRIVEPIKEYKAFRIKNYSHWIKGLKMHDAMDEALKRAGID